jgi:hypothetical protein
MNKNANLRSEEQVDDCADFSNHFIETPLESNPLTFHLIPIERVESDKIELQIEPRAPIGKIKTDLSIFNFEEPHDNLIFQNKNTQDEKSWKLPFEDKILKAIEELKSNELVVEFVPKAPVPITYNIPFLRRQTDLSMFNFEEPQDNTIFENKNTQESVNEHSFNDEPMFLNKLFEGEFDDNHERIFVEEPKVAAKNVEKIVSIPKTPFGRKPLDLSIFTFEDTTLMESVELSFKESCDDELKLLSDQLRGTTIDLNHEKILRNERRKNNRRRRMRKTKSKKERMNAKLTKRLSSLNSPLKRTHWESGKRSRGRFR